MAGGATHRQVHATLSDAQDISTVTLAGGISSAALSGARVSTVARGSAGLGADVVLGRTQIAEDTAKLAGTALQGALSVADVGAGCGAHGESQYCHGGHDVDGLHVEVGGSLVCSTTRSG